MSGRCNLSFVGNGRVFVVRGGGGLGVGALPLPSRPGFLGFFSLQGAVCVVVLFHGCRFGVSSFLFCSVVILGFPSFPTCGVRGLPYWFVQGVFWATF